jgi:hypothetical protein
VRQGHFLHRWTRDRVDERNPAAARLPGAAFSLVHHIDLGTCFLLGLFLTAGRSLHCRPRPAPCHLVR